MPFPRMQCSEPAKLGKLIKRWSKMKEDDLPKTLNEFLKAASDEGFEVSFQGFAGGRPAKVKFLRQTSMDHLYILLPPPGGIDQAFEAIADDGSYPLPDFYNDAFDGTKRTDMSREEQKGFALMRIAEYSTNKCQ